MHLEPLDYLGRDLRSRLGAQFFYCRFGESGIVHDTGAQIEQQVGAAVDVTNGIYTCVFRRCGIETGQ